MPPPTVVADPRFRAGRRLVESGRAHFGAVEMFGTLCEEARAKYGDSSVGTGACYYEYGNALFRAALRAQAEEGEIMGAEDGGGNKPAAAGQSVSVLAAVTSGPLSAASSAAVDDTELALEQMENAWAIFDRCVAVSAKGGKGAEDVGGHLDWIEEQLPRILTGIGDVLAELNRSADAVDAYTRALAHREEAVEGLKGDGGGESLRFLVARRRLCEANVLVAESLLACPRDGDVVTSETGSVLCRAGEILEYAQGYYDRGRDELQEALVLMGAISSQAKSNNDLKEEKENVCFCAQMLGGVGNALADREEQQLTLASAPEAKKQRTA